LFFVEQFSSRTAKRRAIREAIVDDSDASNRAIARQLDVDKNTVGDVRRNIEIPSDPVPSSENTAPDPNTETESESEAGAEAEAEAESETDRDSEIEPTTEPEQPRTDSGEVSASNGTPNPTVQRDYVFPERPEPSDEDRQEPDGWTLRDELEEIERRREIIRNDPDVEERNRFLESMIAHDTIKMIYHQLTCPTCGNGPEHLTWDCCGHDAKEASEIAQEKTQESADRMADDETYGVMKDV
jgi:hypothetical protein